MANNGDWIDKIDNAAQGLEGEALWEHRRRMWRQPTEKTAERLQQRRNSPSMVKLLELIESAQDKENYRDIWDKGINKVYEKLVQGQRLSQPLPLSILVQVVCRAAWVELGIWPLDYVKAEEDAAAAAAAPVLPRALYNQK